MKNTKPLTKKEKDFILFVYKQESGMFDGQFYGYLHDGWPKPRNKKEENILSGRFSSHEKPPIRQSIINSIQHKSIVCDGIFYSFNLNNAGKIIAATLFQELNAGDK